MVAPEIGDAYAKLLREAGVDFIELGEQELCCGSPAHSTGYKKDTEDLAKKNEELFKSHGVKKIICNCPGCMKMLLEYKDIIGFDIEVVHVSEIFEAAIKEGKLSRDKLDEVVTYHDSCHLGRHLGHFDEPRFVIESLGCQLKEMKESREKSFCCGGGGGLRSNCPDIAKKMAEERIKHAKETGAKTVVTACPLCYLHLKENADGLKVKELSELF